MKLTIRFVNQVVIDADHLLSWVEAGYFKLTQLPSCPPADTVMARRVSFFSRVCINERQAEGEASTFALCSTYNDLMFDAILTAQILAHDDHSTILPPRNSLTTRLAALVLPVPAW